MTEEAMKFIEELNISVLSDNNSLDLKYKGEYYTFTIGDQIHKLEIIGLLRYRDSNGVCRKGCICKCSCGNVIGPSRLYQLISGDLVSCGCYSKEIHSKQLKEMNTIHGDSKRNNRTKLYTIWAAMVQRCKNTDRLDSKYYALKGISLYDDWRSFENFKNWALDNGYTDGLTIDRKDNSLGYNPDNCRFVTMKEQQLNKSNVRIIEYNGISDSVAGWANRLGISWSTLDNRLKTCKSIEDAFNFK